MNRRDFVKLAGMGAAGIGAMSKLGSAAEAAPVAGGPGGRSYVAGKFGLELDGSLSGWLWTSSGGNVVGEVVTERIGADGIARKHIGRANQQDITVQCGTGMSKAFYDMLSDMLTRRTNRRNGAIVACDFAYKQRSRLEFRNALVSEFVMPALDAASKDAAKMTVTFSPESTRFQRSNGQEQTGLKGRTESPLQKKWLPANFRLNIKGLEQVCPRVDKIEELAIKAPPVESAIGTARDTQKEPGHLQIPDLIITVPEAYADPLIQWHEDFVIKGNNSQNSERSGTLEYLTPNLKEVLFTIGFQNLGIYAIEPETVEPGAESVRRVKASMYCENMTFAATAAWA